MNLDCGPTLSVIMTIFNGERRGASDTATVLTGPGRRAALLDFFSTRAAAVGYTVEAPSPPRTLQR